MLLVVVISGSAIYTTVDTGCEVSVQGSATGDLTVQESGVVNGESLSVIFRNSASNQIEIRSTDMEGRQNDLDKTISVGETENYEVVDVSTSDACGEYEMSVVYDSGTLSNLEQTFMVKGPFELVQIIVEELLASGDQITFVETEKSVMPTNNSTMCFGGGCGSTDSGSMSGTEKYVNISGDSMQGPLETDDFNAACYGDLCNNTKTNDYGYVSTENNTMKGTLNITELKPINGLCLGGNCS